MSELLLVSRTGPIATLTLNRPDKRNALNGDLVQALTLALGELDSYPAIRAIVLTGAGHAFSAGADLEALQAMQSAPAEANLADSERLARLFEAIYLCSKPVIAKIKGHAIAGGCGLAAVCDFSIASDEAKLGFTEVRIGFVPAIVGAFLVRKMGEAAVRELLLGGGLVTAGRAAQLGLITRAVAADQVDAEVDALANELASATSGTAVALTKRLLADLPGMGLKEALGYTTRLNALARATDDCRAGIAAFLEKRDPPWKTGAGDSSSADS